MVSALSDPDTMTVSHFPWEKDESKKWSLQKSEVGTKKSIIQMGESQGRKNISVIFI